MMVIWENGFKAHKIDIYDNIYLLLKDGNMTKKDGNMTKNIFKAHKIVLLKLYYLAPMTVIWEMISSILHQIL